MLRTKVILREMVRRGAEKAFNLGKSCAFFQAVLKDDFTYLACALLTMTDFYGLHKIS